jgi:predicted RecB family endonuclease
MSDEPKSKPEAKPAASSGPSAGDVACQFVAEELVKARQSLKRSRLVAIILLAVVLSYMGWITVSITSFLEPKSAAEIATGVVAAKVDENATEIAERIRTEVPRLVSEIPDLAIKSLPDWRIQLEERVEEVLVENLTQHSEDFGKQLDDYLNIHRAEIGELLQVVMTSLEQEILEFLDAEMEDGESIKQKLDISLDALKRIESQMDRLANGQDLTEQEKRTRRAIAIISRKVDLHRAPSKDE